MKALRRGWGFSGQLLDKFHRIIARGQRRGDGGDRKSGAPRNRGGQDGSARKAEWPGFLQREIFLYRVCVAIGSELHVAMMVVMVMPRQRWRRWRRQLGDNGLGGDQEAGDRGSILQRGAHDLGRVDDA